MVILTHIIENHQLTSTLLVPWGRLLLKRGPGPWTWTLKSMDLEKHGTKMELKNMSDFIEFCFIKTMRNVICCLKVSVLTDM